jgi:hypothetical protein
MKTLIAALAALALAAPASAASPANDNRADAQLLPDFPSSVHGTTAEATLERLDPQVSKCGRIDGTVWYAIEAAPDGTIVTSVQASARLAPVVRIYRKNQSNIEEVDCGSAAAGGKAVASVSTVRGAGYLILVGRRPGAADGEFDLRAELYAPPENDERGEAAPLSHLPARVHGTTLGAGNDSFGGCNLSGPGVWYRFKGPSTGRAIVQLSAGKRDAAVVAFRRSGREYSPLACAGTDREGNAALAFATNAGGAYFLLVGDRPAARPGDFVLTVRAGEAPETMPGRALPRSGARGSVNGLTDVNDIWWARLERGTTYRIAFRSKPCAQAVLRSGQRTLLRMGCRSYHSFTPGPDGGGRYTFEIVAPQDVQRQAYRLDVVPAGADDLGVGMELAPNSTRRGRLSPGGIDVVDLYHFDVDRLSEVRLGLGQPAGRSFSLTLLSDTGRRIEGDTGKVRRRLGRGRYVVAVQDLRGRRSGRYRLSLRLRDVTSTAMLISGRHSAEVSPGAFVTLEPNVSPAPSGGRVVLQIDRFDPLTGWHFNRQLRVSVGAGVSWRPPAAGRWRVRARFLGTSRSSASRSGYAHLLVARPIR